jgi:nucleoside-diphosphate-sugar epimerase
VVARVFNLLGAGLQDRHLAAALAGQIAAISLGAPPMLRVGPLETTRDFVDVRDAAAAIRLLGEASLPGTYNVASGRETPVRGVLEMLLALASLDDLIVEWLPRRSTDVLRSYASIERLRQVGFIPRHDVESSLGDLYGYYVNDVAPAATRGT